MRDVSKRSTASSRPPKRSRSSRNRSRSASVRADSHANMGEVREPDGSPPLVAMDEGVVPGDGVDPDMVRVKEEPGESPTPKERTPEVEDERGIKDWKPDVDVTFKGALGLFPSSTIHPHRPDPALVFSPHIPFPRLCDPLLALVYTRASLLLEHGISSPGLFIP